MRRTSIVPRFCKTINKRSGFSFQNACSFSRLSPGPDPVIGFYYRFHFNLHIYSQEIPLQTHLCCVWKLHKQQECRIKLLSDVVSRSHSSDYFFRSWSIMSRAAAKKKMENGSQSGGLFQRPSYRLPFLCVFVTPSAHRVWNGVFMHNHESRNEVVLQFVRDTRWRAPLYRNS